MSIKYSEIACYNLYCMDLFVLYGHIFQISQLSMTEICNASVFSRDPRDLLSRLSICYCLLWQPRDFFPKDLDVLVRFCEEM